MSAMIDLRGGYGSKANVAKALSASNQRRVLGLANRITDGERSGRRLKFYDLQGSTPGERAVSLVARASDAPRGRRPNGSARAVFNGRNSVRQDVALGRQLDGKKVSPVRDRSRPRRIAKVDVTMSDRDAHRLAQRYDTRGPLPKNLSRDQRMKAYEARYIASGGKKAEKWKRRADTAEVSRNVGLAAATAAGAGALIARHPKLRRTGKTIARLETASLAGAVHGGASELYGEHARSRRASYQNSPGGVAGSALARMQAYTPTGRKK